jgi:hypothetical protein
MKRSRNNNAKRAQTLGHAAIQAQTRKASQNSPWRRQASCRTARAYALREQFDREDAEGDE